jgi:hypothetical protein
MNNAVVLILLFTAGNNPPTTSAMQEFATLQACHNAAQQAQALVQDLPHVRMRYICVPKG